MKGKLIVIEGSDGSGKTTQVELLSTYLKTEKIPFSIFDFPQYYKTFFGRWIGRFLKGEFGGIKDVPPYIVTIPFAADRWQAKPEMEKALEEGKVVLVNRYTGSNAAYQAAKIDPKEREKFLDWAFQMEYNEFEIPKEDLVIFLYVPLKFSQKMIEQKSVRKYLGNKKAKDIHESNLQFLEEVEKVYLSFCKKYPHWVRIDCTKNGVIMTREEIHTKIVETLNKKKIV